MHLFVVQGFTYPVRAHFLEDVLEITGYKLTSFNQVDDYGQDKLWKTQKQLAPRKRKNQITALVEVCSCIKNLVLIFT
jgi:ATP-dependent RNA helicase DHX36